MDSGSSDTMTYGAAYAPNAGSGQDQAPQVPPAGTTRAGVLCLSPQQLAVLISKECAAAACVLWPMGPRKPGWSLGRGPGEHLDTPVMGKGAWV